MSKNNENLTLEQAVARLNEQEAKQKEYKHDAQKMKLKLLARQKRDKKYRKNMLLMPKIVHEAGRVPIRQYADVTPEMGLLSISDLARHFGTYYSRMRQLLEDYCIISKGNYMWVVRSDLQDIGIAVYVTGLMDCQTRYLLRFTPKGLAIITSLLKRQ